MARRYGELVRLLRERATPLPTNDLWIAAVAFDTGATLLTLDRHFSAVPLLPVAPDPPPVSP